MVEQRMGPQADWSVVDGLMLKTLAAAEKVARYRHAQLSAVRLAGDINAPLIDLEAIWEPQGSRTERGLSKSVPPAGRAGT